MPVTIAMPQMGETVTEGTVTAWFRAVGDEIAVDDALCEISTDKVDSEIPSPVAGVLTEILVAEGETVDIGAPLALVDVGDEAPPPAGDDGEPSLAEATAPEPPRSEPVAEPAARSEGVGFLSPVVRRRLAETGLDPAAVRGTGDGGRITLHDVEAAAAAGPPPDEAPPAPARPTGPRPTAEPGDEVIPFSAIRRATAEHMTRSLATSAHTLVVIEVDYANVEATRDRHKAAFRERYGVSLTYLPFIARATVDAIREYPQVNGAVGDDELIVRSRVNLGVAVDLDFQGLIVPVLKDADGLRMTRLATELAELAGRARERSLRAEDVAGGTFTITNAGGFGTLVTGPIINQPQVAILSTDGIRVKPVAIPEGDGYAVGFHPLGNLALSFDHRAYDGAYASAFLARIRDILETRDWEAEL